MTHRIVLGKASVPISAPDGRIDQAPGVEAGGPPGGRPAFFARPRWEPLRSPAVAFPTAARPPSLNAAVSVIQLAPATVETAREELLPLADGRVDDATRSRAVTAARDAVEAELRAIHAVRCRRRGPADCVVNRPGLASTAFDFTTGRFVGLHIDNHQNRSLRNRSSTDVLVAVNLGPAHRYVVFVPYTVRTLLRRTRLPVGVGQAGTDSIALKDSYLRQHPDGPVLRLRLEPGDAYLAGPQNLIHDGATNDLGRPDVALLLSGDYLPRLS